MDTLIDQTSTPETETEAAVIPPLADLESSPEFKALAPQVQQQVLKGYFTHQETTAKNEDDFNRNLKERFDSTVSAFKHEYQIKFPGDKEIDYDKVKQDEGLYWKTRELANLRGELEYNINKSYEQVKTLQADGMEDKNRKLVLKPYTYKGKQGYSVVYPNGEAETVPIDNMPQLQEFFREKRKDKFDGKRSSISEAINPDNELELILDKLNNTTADYNGAAGLVGDTRKGLSSIFQGFQIQDIESINNGLNRNREARQTIEALTPQVAELERKKAEFPNFAGEEHLQDLRRQLEAAQDVVSNKDASLIGKMSLSSIDKKVQKQNEAQSVIDQLDAPDPMLENAPTVLARLEKRKRDFPDRFDLADEQMLRETREQLAEAKKQVKENVPDAKIARRLDLVNPLGTAVSYTEEQAEPQLVEAYKRLADEMVDAEKIKGSRVGTRVDNYITNRMREDKKKGKDGTYFSYFKDHPSDIMPYVASVSAQALPDLGFIFGSSALANTVAGPGAAAATAQTIGYAREYSASLLTEIQLRAAKEGKPLTDRETIEGYFNDPVFMSRVKQKAAVRASAISLSEAVLGGVAGAIANRTKSTFNKIASTVGVSALTEGAGEAAAIALTEDKMDWRAVAEESIGSLGMGAVSAVTIPAHERAQAAQLQMEKQRAAARLSAPRIDPQLSTLSANPDAVPDSVVDQETMGSARYQKQATAPDNGLDTASKIRNDGVRLPSLPESAFAEPGYQATLEDSLLTEEIKQQDEAVNATEQTEAAPVEGEQSLRTAQQQEGKKDSASLNTKVRDMVRRFLVGFNEAAGNTKTQADEDPASAVDPNDPTEIARSLMANPLYRETFEIISDQSKGSYDRIMEQFRKSGLDTEAAGSLMAAVGLTPKDANKRVLTNTLDNYWFLEDKKGDPNAPLNDFEKQGLIMSAALDEMTRRLTNVNSYNEIPFSEIGKISPNSDILLQMSEEGITTDGEGFTYTHSSTPYVEMDNRESVRRLKAATRAKQASVLPVSSETKDKFKESLLLDREGVKPLDLGTEEFKGKTAKEIAEDLEKRYNGRYIIKSKTGAQGEGVYNGVWDDGSTRGVEEMTKAVQAAMDNDKGAGRGSLSDAYVEPLVNVPNWSKGERGDFKEYRVHIYVDSNGVAHPFPNLTFDKEQLSQQIAKNKLDSEIKDGDTEGDIQGSKEEVQFSVPVSPFDPVVESLQKEAAKQMSKKEFANGIYGLDMAMVEQDGVVKPFIFEANASAANSMSGYAGRNLVQAEMISTLVPGRPSPLAGMYQIAKTGLSREELNAIASSVKERVSHDFKNSPMGSKAIRTGMQLYTPYSSFGKWMAAMKTAFRAPVQFLKQLYNGIRAVFSKTVDPVFQQQAAQAYNPTSETNVAEVQNQEANPEQSQDQAVKETPAEAAPKPKVTTSLPSLPASTLQPTGKKSSNSKSGITLRSYIEKLLPNSLLTESHKQVLKFVLNGASDNFLDGVKVKKADATDTGSSYFMDNSTIYIHKDAKANEVVEEVIHAVTADFVAYNSHALQDALGYDSNGRDNTSEMKAYLEAVNPDNRDMFLSKGVSEDFLDSVMVYLSLLGELGFTQEQFEQEGTFPLGSDASSYAYQAANSDKIPYGAVSITEMMANALSNRSFQKKLSKMPSILTNAKNLFNELVRIMSRMLRIPMNKDNLLFDVAAATQRAITSKDNYFFADLSGINHGDPTAALNSERVNPVQIVDIDGAPFQENEVTQETLRMAARAQSAAELETIRKKAQDEKMERRFDQLKTLYKTVLKGMNYEGMSSLREAREKVVDAMHKQMKLDAAAVGEDADNLKKPSKARKQHAATLIENQVLAVRYFEDFKNDPSIPPTHVELVGKALDYVMNQTAEPMNLTTAEMKYYNNVIMSLSDGGPPTGFKHVLVDQYVQLNMERAALAAGQGKLGAFRRPIGQWRGEVLFGMFNGDQGSTASFASEIGYIATTEKARDFLGKLTGIYRDNINDQQLEEQTQSSAFFDHLTTQFPKGIRPINRHRIGMVARLTQYNAAKLDPLGQLINRYNQLVESIPVMAAKDKHRAALATRALTELVGAANMQAMPDEASFIAHLESGLNPAEKSVLDNIRSVGQYYLPALTSVKALTRNAVLDQYVNYVHDGNITPSESGEHDNLKVTTSQSDVLMEREGINPAGRGTYPDLNIVSIAERQIRSSSYEKYTGVERYLLSQALADSSPLPAVLDQHTDATKPITQRLRKIIDVAHNAKTGSQPGSGPFMATLEGLMNIVQGHLISGVGALTKNFVSSSIQRMGLLSLDQTALNDGFLYDVNPTLIGNWIKKNFPTQGERASEFDTLKAKDVRYSTMNRIQVGRDIREGIVSTMFKTLPYLGQDAIRLYQRTVVDTQSKYSNAVPERRNAFAMFTAAYIHYAKKNGTVTDAQDFLSRLPVDQNAATMASDFVSKSLGYAPDKMNKGSFWNASTATKKIISRCFYVFRQQATGLGIQFQNEAVNASQNLRAGNFDEARKSAIMASSILLNSMSFRLMSMALGSTMLYGGLDRYFDSDDDEEKKRQLLRAKDKNAMASMRNNVRDLTTETIMTAVPIATSAFAFEMMAAFGLDVSKVVIEPDAQGVEVKAKEDLRNEVNNIEKRITDLNRIIREKDKAGLNTIPNENELDKLEVEKQELTEMIKFRYFPNKPLKAALATFGAYGIAAEEVAERIENFVNDDLDDPDKKALQKMLDTEFAYKDPLAGSTFAWDYLRNPAQFIQSIYQFDKHPSNRVPTDLYWKSLLKIGQNPATVVERGRLEMAKQALRKEKELQMKVNRLRKRYLGAQPQVSKSFRE